jgi:hypothetical protein
LSFAGLASKELSEVSLRAIVKQDLQEKENVLWGCLCFKLAAGWFQMDMQTEGLKVELFRLQGGILSKKELGNYTKRVLKRGVLMGWSIARNLAGKACPHMHSTKTLRQIYPTLPKLLHSWFN